VDTGDLTSDKRGRNLKLTTWIVDVVSSNTPPVFLVGTADNKFRIFDSKIAENLVSRVLIRQRLSSEPIEIRQQLIDWINCK